jgi:multidrug efflux system outer membrane protein
MRPLLRYLSPILISLALAGCVNLAPDYQQPAAPIEGQWPLASTGGEGSVASGWRSFFIDARLDQVIELALNNNRDLRVAALNIDKARAQYRIQDAERFPSVSATLSAVRSRALSDSQEAISATQASASVGFSGYELDVFGRLKNLSEAALEDYLALQETRRSTQISLVAEVATTWLTLAADQAQLRLAEDTLSSRQASYDLLTRSHALGGTSGLALAQSQSSLETARGDVASYRSQVLQDRNALILLVGITPADDLLPNGLDAAAAVLVDIPAGLPSSVLQQRPDVLAAEHSLKAANQDVGAARAARFPSISLTGSAGASSTELSNLFSVGSGVWSIGPSVDLALFDAGSRRAGLEAAQSEQQLQLATYEQTVQSAFREVADALAVRSTLQARLDAQQALTAATQKSLQLSDALYHNGASSYLDVLDAQRSLYSAQQTLISLQLTEQANRITLYKVLGGGVAE